MEAGKQANALDECRALLAAAVAARSAAVPADRHGAILALVQAGEALANDEEPSVTAPPGWDLALRLCLESAEGRGPAASAPETVRRWAAQFLDDCSRAARVELALARCATGSLRLQRRETGEFVAWPTTRRPSAEQRERADLAWWSGHLATRLAPQRAALARERPEIVALLGQDRPAPASPWGYVVERPAVAEHFRRRGDLAAARLACQHSYPPEATIGAVTFSRFGELLGALIGWRLLERERQPAGDDAPAASLDEPRLVAALAAALDADPSAVGAALQYCILDRENAAYHGAALGQAAPPLIRLADRRVIWSSLGLLGEPYIFLARELRRRHAQEYHNSAHLREGVFRADLYRLFGDKRFVASPGRVELKRGGAARTDLDALIFDRKTGALGIFELKAQDPFARSVEERQRQRDSFLHANRQVSAALEWVQRHGADDLLVRFAGRTAKHHRVRKVHAFVLGRYLAHFDGGPEPDRRAAWGSWPEVLRLAGREAFGPDDRNPLATLFARLQAAATPVAETDAETLAIGSLRLHLFPSFAALRAAEEGPGH